MDVRVRAAQLVKVVVLEVVLAVVVEIVIQDAQDVKVVAPEVASQTVQMTVNTDVTLAVKMGVQPPADQIADIHALRVVEVHARVLVKDRVVVEEVEDFNL